MTTNFAEQYGTACVVIDNDEFSAMAATNDGAEKLISFAISMGAIYDDEPGSTCIVVQFPRRPQELYTKEAIRRSFSQRRQ